MTEELVGEVMPVTLFTVVYRHESVRLWPVRLPCADGKTNLWWQSGREAAEKATEAGLAQDHFTYTLDDGHGGTAQSSLTITTTILGQQYLVGQSGGHADWWKRQPNSRRFPWKSNRQGGQWYCHPYWRP